MRKGFTLIEILVVIMILASIVSVILAIGTSTGLIETQMYEKEVYVLEKWNYIDDRTHSIECRVKTVDSDGGISIWDSKYCHDQFRVKNYFKVEYLGLKVYKALHSENEFELILP